MPSRQERRKAERDAAKRAPRAGAAGAAAAAGATAALANLNVNQLGDWTTQAEDHSAFRELGTEIVKRKADERDSEAQRSLGYRLVSDTGVAAGRSPKVDLRLAQMHRLVSGRSQDRAASVWSPSDDQMIILP